MEHNNESKNKNLKNWTKDHFIGLSGIILGTFIAVAMPIWNTYFVDTSNLNVEIFSISREISPDAGIILNTSDELKFLSDYIESSSVARFFGRKNFKEKDRLNANDLKDLLQKAKTDFDGLPKKIETYEQDLENISVMDISELNLSKVVTLIKPFPRSKQLVWDKETFRERSRDIIKNKIYLIKIKKQIVSIYKELLESSSSRYSELQKKIPTAERKIEKLALDLQKNNSFFSISAVLSNSGRASTSVKRQSLMRVYIGTQNYVDLELQLNDYKNVARITEYGANIVTYTSEEISSLPIEDQKLINTYWGQSAPAILFKEDIAGNILSSNEITFSEGLNEKLVIDRLKSAARNNGLLSK